MKRHLREQLDRRLVLRCLLENLGWREFQKMFNVPVYPKMLLDGCQQPLLEIVLGVLHRVPLSAVVYF